MMLLATGLLVPSSILANDDMEMMDDVSSEVEEMLTEDLADEPSFLNESSNIQDACTVNFVDQKNGTTTPVSIPFKDGVISIAELVKNFPNSTYCFLSEPQEIKKSDLKGATTKDISVGKITDLFKGDIPWTVFEENVPIVLTYTSSGTHASYTLELSSWKSEASQGVISKDRLTTILKALDSTAPYKITQDLRTPDITPICYKSGSNLIAVGYTATISNALEKVDDTKALANRFLKVKLGNSSEEFELKVADFKTEANPNGCDAKGNVTVNKDTLQNALDQMVSRTRKNYKLKVNNISSQPLNAYSNQVQTLSLNSGDITFSLTPESYVLVQFTTQNKGIHGQVAVQLKQLDKNNDQKVTSSEKEAFLQTYAPLKFAQSDNNNKNDWNFTALDWDSNSLVPTQAIDVVIQDSPEAHYDDSFTITFVDSETGQSMPETKVWNKFFKNGLDSILTQDKLTGAILPDGYGVALEQIPNSTAQTKARLKAGSKQGEFTVSVFNPKAATVYVTKLDTYKDKVEGNIATKPVTPEDQTPATPPAPVEPQQPVIPTQGKQSMFRLYNFKTGEHLYTQSAAEKEKVLSQDGWTDEGQGWTAPAVSAYPVYRVFNPNSGEHHYTKDKNEYDTLIKYGWKGESTAFFSADDVDNKVSLYRLYNPNAPEIAKHHYTASQEERDQLILEGWSDEGTGWFGMPLN